MKLKNILLGFIFGFIVLFPIMVITSFFVMYITWNWDLGLLRYMLDFSFRMAIITGILGAIIGKELE